MTVLVFRATFKIAAAQVSSIRGDILRNIEAHATAITRAAEHQVSVLVFPELSLIGYEPDLADELAITEWDARLAPLAKLSEMNGMDVIVGAALKNGTQKPKLGAILLGADGARRTYAKIHLGSCEPDHFTPGDAPVTFDVKEQRMGLAICADTTKVSHPKLYAERGVTIYAAGVFLNELWYSTDVERFPRYAHQFGMLVLIANHGASVGTLESVGKSAVWSPNGELLAQAQGTESSLIIATLREKQWQGDVIHL